MSALRKLAAMAAILASVHSAEAMKFIAGPPDATDENLYIYGQGTIEKGDAQRFRLLLAAQPLPRGKVIVAFTSTGGAVNEAGAIAAIIEKRHFVTVAMGDECSSACVLAWAAGVSKFIVSKTCIGVHNATVTGVAKQSLAAAEDKWTLAMMTWVAAHGAPHNVLIQMLATPASGMYCLTVEDLTDWKAMVLP